MKIKIRCTCGHKMRVPAAKSGRKVPCSNCRTDLVIPAPDDPGVIERTCECGALLDAAASVCAKCAPAPAPVSAEPPNGPIDLPLGYTLHGLSTVQWLCFCGQQVQAEARNQEQPGTCPRCQAELAFPDVTRRESVWVHCPCGALLPKSQQNCIACGRAVIVNLSAPPTGAVIRAAGPKSSRWPGIALAAAVVIMSLIVARALSREDFAAAKTPATVNGLTEFQPGALTHQPSAGTGSGSGQSGSGASTPASTGSTGSGGSATNSTPAAQNTPSVGPSATNPPGPGNTTPPRETPTAHGTSGTDVAPVPANLPRQTPIKETPANTPPVGNTPPRQTPPEVPVPPDPVKNSPLASLTPLEIALAEDWPVRPADKIKTPPPKAKTPTPNYLYFERKVQPLLARHCLRCHANTKLPVGKYYLQPREKGSNTFSSTATRKNFEATIAFLDKKKPDESKFLLKVLDLKQGGVEHGGGNPMEKGSAAYEALVGFARGDQVEEAKPAADITGDLDIPMGRAASLYGGKSRDSLNQKVRCRWKLLLGPRGSVARLDNDSAREVSFKPDRPGMYLIELVVIDSANVESPAERAVLTVRSATERVGGETAAQVKIPPAFWQQWVQRDLDVFDLDGTFRPAGITTDPDRLALQVGNGDLTPAEYVQIVLRDANFAKRFADEDDRVQQLFQRLMGKRILRNGTEGSWPELVDDLTARKEFSELYLLRHYHALHEAAPSVPDLARWVAAIEADPHAFLSILREWPAVLKQ